MAVESPPPTVVSVVDQSRVAVRVPPAPLAAIDPLPKRLFDISLALLMLVVSAPVWLAIALAIKLDDRGPVFYRQERWGRDQRRIEVLKFRTMVAHSDREFGVRQATADDHRITRVGRLLRATGLDELPQIVNILLGDMSFVGPRALSTNERTPDGIPIRYDETSGFARRLQVRPGLTGLATIYLPKDAPSALKFRVDLLYVSRLSFWLDLRLVALSFWISFRGKWETRTDKL